MELYENTCMMRLFSHQSKNIIKDGYSRCELWLCRHMLSDTYVSKEKKYNQKHRVQSVIEKHQ